MIKENQNCRLALSYFGEPNSAKHVSFFGFSRSFLLQCYFDLTLMNLFLQNGSFEIIFHCRADSRMVDPNMSEIQKNKSSLFDIEEINESEDEDSETLYEDVIDNFANEPNVRKKSVMNPLLFATSDFLAESFEIGAPLGNRISLTGSNMSLTLSDTQSNTNVPPKTKSLRKSLKRLSVTSVSLSDKSKLSNSRSSHTICVPGSDKTILKCDSCGFVSNTKSGFTRHKCTQKPNVSVQSEPVLFKCDQCSKVCRSVPGLKRHKQSAHMKEKTIDNEQSASSEVNSAVQQSAPISYSPKKNAENDENSASSEVNSLVNHVGPGPSSSTAPIPRRTTRKRNKKAGN